MRVSECMTRDPRVCSPDDTLRQAAQAMSELDTGILPVGEGDRLVGMITDRDIAIRGVAEGKGPDSPVREAMTGEVRYCFEDEAVDDVLANMSEIQVRRLPVVNRDKRLVGMVSIGDLSKDSGPRTGQALGHISRPSEQHSQHAH